MLRTKKSVLKKSKQRSSWNAAQILKEARDGRKNYCEWIYSYYNANPLPAVQNAIRHRHTHRGFMADYNTALALVKHAIETGDEPMFASWF